MKPLVVSGSHDVYSDSKLNLAVEDNIKINFYG